MRIDLRLQCPHLGSRGERAHLVLAQLMMLCGDLQGCGTSDSQLPAHVVPPAHPRPQIQREAGPWNVEAMKSSRPDDRINVDPPRLKLFRQHLRDTSAKLIESRQTANRSTNPFFL